MKAPLILSVLAITGISVLAGCQKEMVPNPASTDASTAVVGAAKKDQQQTHMLKSWFDANGVIYPIIENKDFYISGTLEGISNLLGPFQGFYMSYSRYDTSDHSYSGFVSIRLSPDYQHFREQYGNSSSVSPQNKGYNIIANLPLESLDSVNVIVFDKQGNSMLCHATGYKDLGVQGDRLYRESYFEIIGGTGKFEGATGSYTLSGYYSFVTATTLVLHEELLGTIKY